MMSLSIPGNSRLCESNLRNTPQRKCAKCRLSKLRVSRVGVLCRPFGTRLMNLSLPGTDVPGYRLFRPRSTSSGQALRDWLRLQCPSPFEPHNGLRKRCCWGRSPPPGLKPSICVREHFRGFENPLPRTKVRGWHRLSCVFDLTRQPILRRSTGTKSPTYSRYS